MGSMALGQAQEEKTMRRNRRTLGMVAVLAACVLAIGLAYGAGKYGPGASDTEIKIGHTNPYSGPASSYHL